MKTFWFKALVVCVGFGLSNRTLAETVVCPSEIDVEQTLAIAQESWEEHREGTSPKLTAVKFYEGHPRQEVSLIPDSATTKRTRKIATWRFTREGYDYWIACQYDRTAIVMTRRLDAKIRQCNVTYSRHKGGRSLIRKIECQS